MVNVLKPPKCKLCQREHWSDAPHVFEDAASDCALGMATVNKAVNKAKPVNIGVNHSGLTVDAKLYNQACERIMQLEARVAELEQPADRKQYMREYMRKRRAN